MGVTLEIEKPGLLGSLMKRLEANGCVAHELGAGICHVVHPQAVDPAEEWLELRFFLRAWQASEDGVALKLDPDQAPAASSTPTG